MIGNNAMAVCRGCGLRYTEGGAILLEWAMLYVNYYYNYNNNCFGGVAIIGLLGRRDISRVLCTRALWCLAGQNVESSVIGPHVCQ